MVRTARLLSLCLLAAGCDQQPSPPPEPPEPLARQAPAPVDPQALSEHVEFLAADARQGRAPGTEGDQATQDYIEQAMRTAGLEPGFGTTYRQTFEVVDGVRLAHGGGSSLELGGQQVPHSLLPFAADTTASGPVEAPLVFVGYGITAQGGGDGDYEGLEAAVKGSIVIALAGGPSNDPHLPPGATRPQNKMIAARDRGAVAFILWDPASASSYPNHGRADALGLPALAVGSGANVAIQSALGVRKPEPTVDPDAVVVPKGAKSKKPARVRSDVERVVLDTANVAGLLFGNGTTSKMVVVGAHHDHLGMGTSSSLAPGEVAVHNGADDNASGVAGLLELCGALAQLPPAQRPYDVLCVTFGAEEMGLLGSRHFVESLDDVRRENIVAMINFDMIGRMKENEVVVAGVGTAPQWSDLVAGQQTSLSVATKPDGQGPSDHAAFYGEGVPVLHFFTGAHADYHKPSDDTDKLDYAGMAAITNLALLVVDDIVHEQVTFAFQKTKAKSPGGRRAFKVSLGTIPDYAADVDGLKLSGVRQGGPAETAGLRKGDVIKKMGEREIHSIDDYMAAFGELVPGEAVPVVIEREGAAMELQLTPGAPKRH